MTVRELILMLNDLPLEAVIHARSGHGDWVKARTVSLCIDMETGEETDVCIQ